MEPKVFALLPQSKHTLKEYFYNVVILYDIDGKEFLVVFSVNYTKKKTKKALSFIVHILIFHYHMELLFYPWLTNS